MSDLSDRDQPFLTIHDTEGIHLATLDIRDGKMTARYDEDRLDDAAKTLFEALARNGEMLAGLLAHAAQQGREAAAQVIEDEAREYEKQYGVHGSKGALSGLLFEAARWAREGKVQD